MRGLNGTLKVVLAMIGLQCIAAGFPLSAKAAFLQGMRTTVFVVYRQAVATLIMAPIAYFTRKNPHRTSLGLRTFSLMFMTSLIGITCNQNAYYEGLYLSSSSSIATAMLNLLPAITFVMAAIVGLEKINVGSLSSIAKITGTILCVVGAVCMALIKGPKLFNAQLLLSKSVMSGNIGGANFQMGCLFLFLGCCCWSFWMIMQVPISASCPDHLYSNLWMCFLGTIQSTIFTLLIDHDLEVWNLHSVIELGSVLFAGIGTAVYFIVQAWCISQKGPVFAAMFSPLGTVIATIIAFLFLNENIYIGSVLGGIAVVGGLYVVLWGKAKDFHAEELENQRRKTILIDDQSSDHQKGITSCTIGLEKPLLSHRSSNADENEDGLVVNISS